MDNTLQISPHTKIASAVAKADGTNAKLRVVEVKDLDGIIYTIRLNCPTATISTLIDNAAQHMHSTKTPLADLQAATAELDQMVASYKRLSGLPDISAAVIPKLESSLTQAHSHEQRAAAISMADLTGSQSKREEKQQQVEHLVSSLLKTTKGLSVLIGAFTTNTPGITRAMVNKHLDAIEAVVVTSTLWNVAFKFGVFM